MKVKDEYQSPDDFKLMLDTAGKHVSGAKEEDFLASLAERFEQFGMDTFLSDGQSRWLTDIARRG